LQCVAVYCSVLQCVAVCCSVLQCVAVCCSVLQCVAVCCSVMRYVAVQRIVMQCVAVCCSDEHQCALAVYCSVLQYVAVCCSVLQCVAVCCDVLQQYTPVRPLPPLQCVATRFLSSAGVAVYCGVLQCVAAWCSVLQCVAMRFSACQQCPHHLLAGKISQKSALQWCFYSKLRSEPTFQNFYLHAAIARPLRRTDIFFPLKSHCKTVISENSMSSWLLRKYEIRTNVAGSQKCKTRNSRKSCLYTGLRTQKFTPMCFFTGLQTQNLAQMSPFSQKCKHRNSQKSALWSWYIATHLQHTATRKVDLKIFFFTEMQTQKFSKVGAMIMVYRNTSATHCNTKGRLEIFQT